jgi:hypothetical protein
VSARPRERSAHHELERRSRSLYLLDADFTGHPALAGQTLLEIVGLLPRIHRAFPRIPASNRDLMRINNTGVQKASNGAKDKGFKRRRDAGGQP